MPPASNELCPLLQIHSGEVSSNAAAVNQRRIDSRLRRGSSLRSGYPVTSTKLRDRASSDAGALAANSQARNRSGSTSFGSTQGYEDVHELLKLRNQRLKEAYRKGDEIELRRLKNLNLFDDIERPQSENEELKEAAVRVDLTEQSDHYGFTLPTNSLDSDFIPRPKSVNQGHTATLCWHLKLEHTQGLVVPQEFALCRIHPTPNLGASSDSSSTPQRASPDSSSSASISSLSHVKISSVDTFEVRHSSEPSSSATTSSKEIKSEATLSTKASSFELNPREEDPFLYIAKYINRHAKRDGQKEFKSPASQAPNADVKRLTHIQCTCANHSCRTYLSGPSSKHCRSCKLPRPQPEILAAVKRIEQMKISAVSAQAVTEQLCEADEFRKFEALQEDMKLVEMFYAETEKRCRNGVWWEGWLIVQDLKRQGIVGSQPFVYVGDKALVA